MSATDTHAHERRRHARWATIFARTSLLCFFGCGFVVTDGHYAGAASLFFCGLGCIGLTIRERRAERALL